MSANAIRDISASHLREQVSQSSELAIFIPTGAEIHQTQRESRRWATEFADFLQKSRCSLNIRPHFVSEVRTQGSTARLRRFP
jgi:hypothetical protein